MSKRVYEVREEIKKLQEGLIFADKFLSKYNPRVTTVGVNVHDDDDVLDKLQKTVFLCGYVRKHLDSLILKEH